MNSSDNSVKLTSHRIIYDSDKGRQQIMLDEFVSYELKHNSIGAYGIIFFSFAALAVVITINKITNYNEGQVFFMVGLLSVYLNSSGWMMDINFC